MAFLLPNAFRASSDQDVRHRITFSGGWDLPIEQAWNSGPKRLTQGWSLFPDRDLAYRIAVSISSPACRIGSIPGAKGRPVQAILSTCYANVVGSLNSY